MALNQYGLWIFEILKETQRKNTIYQLFGTKEYCRYLLVLYFEVWEDLLEFLRQPDVSVTTSAVGTPIDSASTPRIHFLQIRAVKGQKELILLLIVYLILLAIFLFTKMSNFDKAYWLFPPKFEKPNKCICWILWIEKNKKKYTKKFKLGVFQLQGGGCWFQPPEGGAPLVHLWWGLTTHRANMGRGMGKAFDFLT